MKIRPVVLWLLTCGEEMGIHAEAHTAFLQLLEANHLEGDGFHPRVAMDRDIMCSTLLCRVNYCYIWQSYNVRKWRPQNGRTENIQ
jgi:hypothetical protein